MVASIIILVFSVLLVLYWFRYSCILMLRNSTAEVQAAAVDSHFNFVQAKELLRGDAQLAAVERALDRDYRLVTYLIQHAAGLDLNSLEDRLLVLDCRLMRLYYRVTRSAAPKRARYALREMADVLTILASRLDERAGLRSVA